MQKKLLSILLMSICLLQANTAVSAQKNKSEIKASARNGCPAWKEGFDVVCEHNVKAYLKKCANALRLGSCKSKCVDRCWEKNAVAYCCSCIENPSLKKNVRKKKH